MLESNGSLSTEFKAEAVSDLYQPGDLKLSVVSTLTSGWLECNGAAVSRVPYAGLFAAIGTTFGIGDGSSTFNLPDFRDRFPIGQSNTKAIGSTGGADSVTLTITELPSHNHSTTVPHFSAPGNGSSGGGAGWVIEDGSAAYGSSSTGGGAPFSIMPPWMAVKFLIKT